MRGKRKCRQCLEIKGDLEFYRDVKGTNGQKSICIECTKENLQEARDAEASRPLAQPLVLDEAPERCPRCTGLLEIEPLYARCRYGCGRLFRLAGGNLAQQRAYENSRGMLTA